MHAVETVNFNGTFGARFDRALDEVDHALNYGDHGYICSARQSRTITIKK